MNNDRTAVFLLKIPDILIKSLDEFLNQYVVPRGVSYDLKMFSFEIEARESELRKQEVRKWP